MSDIKVSTVESETMLEGRVPPTTPQTSPSSVKIQNYPAEEKVKVRKKPERKRRKRNSKEPMSDDASTVHISAWQIILTKVLRIHHSQVSAKVLFHEVADVLEKFTSLVQDACTVTAKSSNHQDDGNVTSSVEHFYPDPLMCRLLDIPAPTSDSKSNLCQAKIVFKSEIQTFIYQSIRDSQANNVNTSMLEGAFEGLAHEAASAAFEDLASESAAFDLDWHPLLDPDPGQKEEKDLQPIKIETEVKPELKVKVEMVESTVGNSQSDVKLEPNALSKSDEKQDKNQNPEKNSAKDESVSPKNNENRTRSHMAEVSSGLVWHKDYWVNKDTFDSMRSGEIPSKCPKCPKVFKRLFGLVRHWRGDKCPSIAGPVLYEEVKDEASGRKRYTCTVEGCPEVAAGKSWQNKTSFESHVAKKHDSISIKKFECEDCDQKFISKTLLTKHRWSEHVDSSRKKAYTCSLCGRVLNKRQSLIAHERSHTGERPFKCEYCERRFITKQSLSRHIMNKHAAESGLPVPVHVCELCGKEFKSKKNLKEHRYYHAENTDNRQQCEICHKVLKQKNSYMKHMVNVHKKGFECSVCQKIIATEEGLKLHKRDQHKIQIQVL